MNLDRKWDARLVSEMVTEYLVWSVKFEILEHSLGDSALAEETMRFFDNAT